MNIQEISDRGLCSACGGCEAICPLGAISISENKAGFLKARVDTRCIECGLCVKCCPSVKLVDNVEEPEEIQGHIDSCYIGYANDNEIRKHAQSGGAATAIMLYLIDCNEVGGAVVSGFDYERRRPFPQLVTSKEELINCAGSMYVQVPMLSRIKSVDCEYVVSTVGCESESLELMKKKESDLIRQPAYILGLLCEGEYSGCMIDHLAKIKKEDCLKYFKFRDKSCGGWPGDIHFNKNKIDYIKDSKERFVRKRVYENHRCIFCNDILNRHADVVFGDPWGIPNDLISNKKEGETVFYSRTEKGEKLIRAAIETGYITARRIPAEYILNAQAGDMYKRQRELARQLLNTKNLSEKLSYDMSLVTKGICFDKENREDVITLIRRLSYSHYINCAEDDVNIQMVFLKKTLNQKILTGLDSIKKNYGRIIRFAKRKIFR